jgi:hypothetical protein
MIRQGLILKLLKRFIPSRSTPYHLLPTAKRGQTKPNKAKRVKAIIMSEMYEKSRKQSQTNYRACFQALAAILGPFFGKNECFPSMICGIGSNESQTKPSGLSGAL